MKSPGCCAWLSSCEKTAATEWSFTTAVVTGGGVQVDCSLQVDELDAELGNCCQTVSVEQLTKL
jgi:hypothetical protein